MSSVAVVTGASSGIGLATASHLRSQGWTVVGLDILNPLDPGSIARSDPLHELHCDLRFRESVDLAFQAVAARYSHLDALICSAGIFRIGALDAMSVDDFDLMFSVNVRGAWLCARAALPLLRRAAKGERMPRIVFVGSISGLRPKVGSGAYAASKAALHTPTGVLAAELGPEGILVNAVAPGTVDTPMMKAVGSDAGAGRYRPSGTSPLGRIARPDDIVSVIEFLLGPGANYVTGVILPVDGGTRAAFAPSLPEAGQRTDSVEQSRPT